MSTKLIDREAIMKEFDRLIRPCTINRRRLIEAAHSPLFLQQLHIAIIALNEGTEVSDFLSAYGVLVESGVADVTVVADRTDPIRLYPSIRAAPQATTAQFDASRPEGADYVVVPRDDPHNDPAIIAWIKAQHRKAARIVSICNGSLTLASAGLLDERRATGHWYYIKRLQAKHPTKEWVRDRRYVVDRGVATSTSITASIPLMMALVEAIGGRAEAEKLSMRLGCGQLGCSPQYLGFPAHRRAPEDLRSQQVDLLAARCHWHQG